MNKRWFDRIEVCSYKMQFGNDNGRIPRRNCNEAIADLLRLVRQNGGQFLNQFWFPHTIVYPNNTNRGKTILIWLSLKNCKS